MTTATTIEKKEGTQVRPERTRGGRVFSPSVDILENKDELLLLADVPGAKPENIDIQCENGELAIHVRVDPRQQAMSGHCVGCEYGVGDFHRSFQLGETIDNAKIHADVKNGVLTVHLPKAEAAKPRKIAVKSQ
jgi:HSP20 family protein